MWCKDAGKQTSLNLKKKIQKRTQGCPKPDVQTEKNKTNKKNTQGRKDELSLWVFKRYTWGPHFYPSSQAPPHTPRQALVSVCHVPCYLSDLPPRPSLLAAHSVHSSHGCLLLVSGTCRCLPTPGPLHWRCFCPHATWFCPSLLCCRCSHVIFSQGLPSPPHLCTLCLPFLI